MYDNSLGRRVIESRGIFQFSPGQTVEFSIGGVIIGSALAQAVLTPVDLVAGGSADNTEVQNIARFLMLLDENNDPSDGIAISESVRDAAENWTQVDFGTANLDNELVTIISDVASVDSRTPVLPSAADAREKILSDAYCAMTGFFFGRMTGDQSNDFALIVSPATGRVTAFYSNASANFQSTDPIAVNQTRTFLAPATNEPADSIEGRFDSYDEISGVWTVGATSGEFTASRRIPNNSVAYRFTGRFHRGIVGPLLDGPLIINVDNQGNVLVDSHDFNFGRDFTATGTFLNNEFSYDYGDGQEHTGTADANLVVVGSGIQGNGRPRPWLAVGCRLN